MTAGKEEWERYYQKIIFDNVKAKIGSIFIPTKISNNKMSKSTKIEYAFVCSCENFNKNLIVSS